MQGAIYYVLQKQSANDLYFDVGHVNARHRGPIFATRFDVVEVVVDKDITLVSQVRRVSKFSVQNSSEFCQTSLNVHSDISQALEHVASVWRHQIYEELAVLDT